VTLLDLFCIFYAKVLAYGSTCPPGVTYPLFPEGASAVQWQAYIQGFETFDDLAGAARVTALRAAQVHGLYDFAADRGTARGLQRLADARKTLDEAALIVVRPEAAYRVDPDRIAGWRNNPTAYGFGYLWTVRRFCYWWRDEGKGVDRPWTPCYLNILNPVDVAFGEGIFMDVARALRYLSGQTGWLSWLLPGLAEPDREPTFPQDNLRSRP
jgi:hypothetical protein